MEKKTHKKKIAPSNNFHILIALPVCVITISMLIIVTHIYSDYKTLLHENYVSTLKSAFMGNEYSINTIIENVSFLEYDKNITELITNSKNINYASAKDISDAVDSLDELAMKYNIIDSISLVNRSQNYVITSNGKYGIDEYFEDTYSYSNYPYDFWYYYQLIDVNYYQVQAPSMVSKYGLEQSVIPIVFTAIGNTRTSNLLIVNLSIPEIIKSISNKNSATNSNYFILNKMNGQIFGIESNNTLTSTASTSFYEKIVSSKIGSFNTRNNIGKKELIIYYNPKISILGYCYYIAIPYSTIFIKQLPTILFIFITMFICVILTILSIFFSTNQIMSPIKSLALLFKPEKEIQDGGNIIEYIHSATQRVLDKNINLSNDFATALPYAKEKYLIDLLNSNENRFGDQAQEIINDKIISFNYEYFASVIIQLNPTNSFFEKYNNTDYLNIQSGFYNVIKSIFSEKYQTFIISSERDTLYVLLNLPDDSDEQGVRSLIHNIDVLLETDMGIIELYIGYGGIYHNIEGLRQAHKEAIRSLSLFQKNIFNLKIDTSKLKKCEISYLFKLNDETTLFNYLMAGNCNEANRFIEKVCNENINLQISRHSLNQLHTQVINVIFKVMRIKNIEYDNENIGDLEIIADIINQPLNDIYKNIVKLTNHISNNTNHFNSKKDVDNILTYIHDHYNEELYLEFLADSFQIKANYLSKIIKNKLGIGFQEYLTNLRISHAKVMLINSEYPIQEICKEVGFNNKATFIRCFKKITGITPSEYRNNNKK